MHMYMHYVHAYVYVYVHAYVYVMYMYIYKFMLIYIHTIQTLHSHTHTHTHTHTHCLVASAHASIHPNAGNTKFCGGCSRLHYPINTPPQRTNSRHQILRQLTSSASLRISQRNPDLSLARSLARSASSTPLRLLALSPSLNDSWQQRGAGGAFLRLVCSRDRAGNTGPGSLRSLR